MNAVEVKSRQVRFPVAEDLYGLFYEDINRSGDSGLYPELLRNRSFEDSLTPEECTLDETGEHFVTPTGWVGEFNGGEGLKRWSAGWAPTPVPAWYLEGEGQMELNRKDTLNPNRKCSLDVFFAGAASLYNIGYAGISVRKGEALHFYLFAKIPGEGHLRSPSNSDSAAEKPEAEVMVTASLRDEAGRTYASAAITMKNGEFTRGDCRLTPDADGDHLQFHLSAAAGTTIRLGFVSLMPEDTYLGHGLRWDLVEKLAGLHPKFMRFPGGCIVEGVTKSNALRFSQMIGPVWERPSNFLLWFYRTTNGFGYHEFLQLCEDLGMAAMYVVNCGITCQARKPDFFVGEEREALYQECVDAIEYAIAPVGTPMGDKRAAAGHPEPFDLKYIEIGNENRDEPYFQAYRWFYDRLKKAYPQIIYVSNCHTEEAELPTEVVDEHYYSDLDFFVCHHDLYDRYSRTGPKIFVGEYAVTVGEYQSAMAAALGEGAFLTGIERNQDVVALTSYAPLLLNENFMSWTPDLIVFNGKKSYGIPSYYLQRMFAENRGTHVVEETVISDRVYLDPPGWAGIYAEGPGCRFRNCSVNQVRQNAAKEVPTMFQPVFPFLCQGDGWVSGDGISYSLFDSEQWTEIEFQADVQMGMGGAAALTMGNRLIARGYAAKDQLPLTYEGLVYYAWKIQDSKSALYVVRREKTDRISPLVEVSLKSGEHHWSVEWKNHCFTCRIDGEVIHQNVEAASMPVITASAVVDQKKGDIIVKLVNTADEALEIPIYLDVPVESLAEAEVLAAARKTERNSMEEPERVAPRKVMLEDSGMDSVYHAPGNSVSVIRYHIQEEPASLPDGGK